MICTTSFSALPPKVPKGSEASLFGLLTIFSSTPVLHTIEDGIQYRGYVYSTVQTMLFRNLQSNFTDKLILIKISSPRKKFRLSCVFPFSKRLKSGIPLNTNTISLYPYTQLSKTYIVFFKLFYCQHYHLLTPIIPCTPFGGNRGTGGNGLRSRLPSSTGGMGNAQPITARQLKGNIGVW